MVQNILIVGGSGAIGKAFVSHYAKQGAHIHALSRTVQQAASDQVIYHQIDYDDENTLAAAIQSASTQAPFDRVIIATGLLHENALLPEKSLRDLSADKFQRIFAANTIVPSLIAKHALPKLNREAPSHFAALSARIGSISDNQLGGWYAYRASKAALNMIIRNAAIETARRNKHAVIVGLHPGTVDSPLSAPFRSTVAAEKLFSPTFAAQSMAAVLEGLTPAQSGKCFAWDGQEVQP